MKIGELLDFTAYLRSHHGAAPSIGLILVPDDSFPLGLLRSITRSLDASMFSYEAERDGDFAGQLLDTVRGGRGAVLILRHPPRESLTKALRYLNQPFPERYPAPVIILLTEALYHTTEHWHPLRRISPVMRSRSLQSEPASALADDPTGEHL